MAADVGRGYRVSVDLLQICGLYKFHRIFWILHRWRLRWNIIMEVWFRSFSFLNGSFVGSILIFQGVSSHDQLTKTPLFFGDTKICKCFWKKTTPDLHGYSGMFTTMNFPRSCKDRNGSDHQQYVPFWRTLPNKNFKASFCSPMFWWWFNLQFFFLKDFWPPFSMTRLEFFQGFIEAVGLYRSGHVLVQWSWV